MRGGSRKFSKKLVDLTRNDPVTTCPNVISITKFVIVETYGVPTYSGLFSRRTESGIGISTLTLKAAAADRKRRRDKEDHQRLSSPG